MSLYMPYKYRIRNLKTFLSRERSVRMQLSHMAHVRIAYFTRASGMIWYAMAIEHSACRAYM